MPPTRPLILARSVPLVRDDGGRERPRIVDLVLTWRWLLGGAWEILSDVYRSVR